jgi:hypothetical protein
MRPAIFRTTDIKVIIKMAAIATVAVAAINNKEAASKEYFTDFSFVKLCALLCDPLWFNDLILPQR